MPLVSVIMPVYNAERFLRQAIDSILAQTFTDFELLLLNDGSTDGSETIMHSYRDKRIIILANAENRGLIYTLNLGIDKSQGKFLARMDADDIASSGRLEKQVRWLDENRATAIVASYSSEIDDAGNDLGFYERDRRLISAAQIRRAMPSNNCITHPSVMGRTEIFKAYKYSQSQKNIEDYDLWLRLLADGNIIEKIPEPLLLYRVHQTSITQTKLRRQNFFLKHFQCKRRYLAQRFSTGRFNLFDLQVLRAMVMDGVKAGAKATKELIIRKQ